MSSSRDSDTLCASCDRCRSRKTRCDGQRPCGSCKQRYMKAHKLTSCDGLDEGCFECVYSPAKKRGPAPGHKQLKAGGAAGGGGGGSSKKKKRAKPRRSQFLSTSAHVYAAEVGSGSGFTSTGGGMGDSYASSGFEAMPERRGSGTNATGSIGGLLAPMDPGAAALQQQMLSTLGNMGIHMLSTAATSLAIQNNEAENPQPQQDTMAVAQNEAQRQLAYIQQLQLQQQMQEQQQRRDLLSGVGGTGGMSNDSNVGGAGQRQPPMPVPPESSGGASSAKQPPTVLGCAHPHALQYRALLGPHDPTGARLRACHALSFGGLFALPPIPSNEEYCRLFDESLEPHQLPKFDVAALQAARFAQLALGALADTDRELMVALADASVWCLRDCVEEQVHPSLMFDLARTYFFHSIVRMQLGDMEGYFKYRRVCLRHLVQLDEEPGVETIMAAVSFQDSLAYMMFNASEDDVPAIDSAIPRVSQPVHMEGQSGTTDAEKRYHISVLPSRVASNPINQLWMQGAPPVLINEAAPRKSRVLDALSFVVRSTLDEAKARQTKEPVTQSRSGRVISRKRKFLSDAEAKDKSATEWAVEHHPEDLSCSTLLATASDLLEKEEEASATNSVLRGHRLVLSAVGAIVNIDNEAEDLQLEKICSILENVIVQPMLLFQGGPTYHLINNCAILLAHIINSLHDNGFEVEGSRAKFDAALDVYKGSRILLARQRKRLPAQLQCNEIPAPDVASSGNEEGPVIDVGQISLCPSRKDVPSKEAAKRVTSADSDEKPTSKEEEAFATNDKELLAVLSRLSGSI
ncbi:hypothetical protein ACHAXT_006710 [Thalassiosira profunda]